MDNVDTALCAYDSLNDGEAHRFILLQGSREAVKALANQIEQLQIDQKWYGQDHVRLFIDARAAIGLPIRFLFETLSDYNRPYPDLVPPRITLAYLRSPDTVILDVYHMMAELFEPPLSVQFFIEEDRAKRWLLESQ